MGSLRFFREWVQNSNAQNLTKPSLTHGQFEFKQKIKSETKSIWNKWKCKTNSKKRRLKKRFSKGSNFQTWFFDAKAKENLWCSQPISDNNNTILLGFKLICVQRLIHSISLGFGSSLFWFRFMLVFALWCSSECGVVEGGSLSLFVWRLFFMVFDGG